MKQESVICSQIRYQHALTFPKRRNFIKIGEREGELAEEYIILFEVTRYII